MMPPANRVLALLAALVAAAPLAVALIAERVFGVVPCALCLLERWPYRVVVLLGLAAALLGHRPARALLWLAVLVMLAGAGLGAVHVGVEQGFWPSPLPECAAPRLSGGSIAERLAALPARPAKPCDEPTHLIPFLPLSMAAMNFLAALAIAAGLAMLLWRERRGTA